MVVFKDGQVIRAASDGIRDSLGNILVSQGMLDSATLSPALARQQQQPDTPLGMILAEMGAVPAQTLEGVIRKQIEEIIYGPSGMGGGLLQLRAGRDPSPKDKIEIDTQEFLLKTGINAEYLLMEGTRILDEKRKDQPRPAPAAGASAPHHASYEPAKEEFRTRIEKEAPSKQITALKSMFDELRSPHRPPRR